LEEIMLDSVDHRQIGQRLGLFHFQEEAPGMVFWHPRGLALYRLLEGVARRQTEAQGYQEVRTPQVLRQPIWEKSGHWQHFREDMFVLDEEGRAAALKPVSCPGHIQLALREAPSYRDLPLRFSELGLVHRNERSGTLAGLFRLRQFTQDDGHIFCSEDQIEAEVSRFCRGAVAAYQAFGFAAPRVLLSTRPADRAGDDDGWDWAEARLGSAAAAAGLAYELHGAGGAFYGPKLELVLKDRAGREWACGTIQLDRILPERFELDYAGADGRRHRPVMLHRAVFGSLERFLAVLLEHHEGALPPWLAPEQVAVLPVAAAQREGAAAMVDALRAAGLRARLDDREGSLGGRVAAAHEDGVPFIAVAGARELQGGSVTLRERGGGQRSLPLEVAIEELRERCRPPL
jgi:threonyl-tRNA synthetase